MKRYVSALRRVPLSVWVWWAATTVLWPVWLLVVLGAQLAAFLVAETAKAPVYGALGISGLVAVVLCALGSWFVGGTAAVNGAPLRLWRAPAVYGAVAALGVLAVDVVQWSQGVPGPPPWPTPTAVGFVVVSSLGIVPALAAAAFVVGVRAAGPQIAASGRRHEAAGPAR